MFTIVVCLVVVVVACAAVIQITFSDQHQPATPPRPRHRASQADGPAARRSTTILEVRPGRARRIRSTLALIVMLGLVGALLALAIGTILTLIVLGTRSAVL
ncbi:MAG TPA: hypothetical protein VMN58_01125 [Acidimicrobiales bacterium]|nr:hypothetical protein [Acidimicrobiales bacterium]